MRRALGLVGVEQRVAGPPPEHADELPGEVGRVADARAHALAEEGRRLVRGVPGDQQRAVAPAPGDHRVEGVGRRALELGVLGGDPALEQLPDPRGGGHRLRVLAGQDRDLPAPAVARAAHVGRRAGRVAVLHAVVAEAGHRALEDRVHHQPALVEAEVVERRADEPAHQRARPVAAHHVARPAAQEPAGGEVLEAHGDAAVLGPVEREDLAARADRHARPPRDAGAEHALEVGLVEAVAGVPALRADLHRARPVEHQAALGVDEAHPGRDVRVGGDLLGQAGRLEDAHHLVVDGHGARQVVGRRLALQHQGGDAAAA